MPDPRLPLLTRLTRQIRTCSRDGALVITAASLLLLANVQTRHQTDVSLMLAALCILGLVILMGRGCD